jgi:transmembrane sensor
MNPEAERNARQQIAERAAFWLLTLQSGEVTSAQRAEFVDWLRRSPQHIAEMLRVCQVQRELAGFKGWEQLLPLDEVLPAEVVRFLPAAAASRARRFRLPARTAALLVAGVAALCIVGLLMFTRLNQTEFRTQAGERREVTLTDGSVIELSPDSDVIVRFRAQQRSITLDHGEAQFRVTKDPNRPFIVQADMTRVHAVGTVFSVDRSVQGVSVMVVEGRVAVSQQRGRFSSSGAGPALPVLSLQAHEQVSISPAGVASSVRKISGAVEAGSDAGELVFENETIGEVARRFNLLNSTRIDILDSRLAARRISGVFRGNDPQSFVAFIQAAADIHVSQRDYQHIVLGSPEADSSDATR